MICCISITCNCVVRLTINCVLVAIVINGVHILVAVFNFHIVFHEVNCYGHVRCVCVLPTGMVTDGTTIFSQIYFCTESQYVLVKLAQDENKWPRLAHMLNYSHRTASGRLSLCKYVVVRYRSSSATDRPLVVLRAAATLYSTEIGPCNNQIANENFKRTSQLCNSQTHDII
jgi:hypothetical protein